MRFPFRPSPVSRTDADIPVRKLQGQTWLHAYVPARWLDPAAVCENAQWVRNRDGNLPIGCHAAETSARVLIVAAGIIDTRWNAGGGAAISGRRLGVPKADPRFGSLVRFRGLEIAGLLGSPRALL